MEFIITSCLYEDFCKKSIIEQTQNVANGQDLQNKLLELSNKMNEKFAQSLAHNLTFEIMCIAQGIFSKEEDKNDYLSQLPSEVRQKIYSELIVREKNPCKVITGLEALFLVSKIESKIANETKIAWINNGNISLKRSGCNTIQEAIYFIKSNKNLQSANFCGFENFTNENLKEIQDCTWIQNLCISSDRVTNKGLKFLKKLPLHSVDFSSCYKITNKGFNYLKRMPLQSIIFSDCNGLTDKAFEYLKGMTTLQRLDFSLCEQLTDKAIEYLKGMRLQRIDFSHCNLLTDNALEHLRGMPLKRVDFDACYLLTDKSLEYLQGMPLQSINFPTSLQSYPNHRS